MPRSNDAEPRRKACPRRRALGTFHGPTLLAPMIKFTGCVRPTRDSWGRVGPRSVGSGPVPGVAHHHRPEDPHPAVPQGTGGFGQRGSGGDDVVDEHHQTIAPPGGHRVPLGATASSAGTAHLVADRADTTQQPSTVLVFPARQGPGQMSGVVESSGAHGWGGGRDRNEHHRGPTSLPKGGTQQRRQDAVQPPGPTILEGDHQFTGRWLVRCRSPNG